MYVLFVCALCVCVSTACMYCVSVYQFLILHVSVYYITECHALSCHCECILFVIVFVSVLGHLSLCMSVCLSACPLTWTRPPSALARRPCPRVLHNCMSCCVTTVCASCLSSFVSVLGHCTSECLSACPLTWTRLPSALARRPR